MCAVRRRHLPWWTLLILTCMADKSPASASLEEKASQKVSKGLVLAVTGYAAELPCELTPLSPTDAPQLILWYKDIFGTPIYSFDMRGDGDGSGRHWMDRRAFGGDNRASFHVIRTGRYTDEGVQVLRAFLRINALKKGDAGPYRCRVDFKEAPTRNVKVRLDLVELPTRPRVSVANGTTLVKDASPPMKIGASLVLNCQTTGGSPRPTLKWWTAAATGADRRRTNLRAEREQTVESLSGKPLLTSTVRLQNLSRDDLGVRVGCAADNTNLVENPTTEFKINMLLPPIRAKIVREWSYFLSGKSYSVSCQVMGSHPTAYTNAWVGEAGGSGRANTRELPVQNFEVSADGSVSTTRVTFVPTESDDGAYLTCRAENPHLPANNGVEDQWKIEVQYLPRVNLSTNAVAVEDRNRIELSESDEAEVRLRCAVHANPHAHAVKWLKEGTALSPETTGVSAVGDEQQVLILSKVDSGMKGNYSCVAENLVGTSEESNRIELVVKYRPRCARQGALVYYAALNETVELPCAVDAVPADRIGFTWTLLQEARGEQKFGRDGTTKEVVSTLKKKLIKKSSSSYGLVDRLTYELSSDSDFGFVYCSAENSAGVTRTGGGSEKRALSEGRRRHHMIGGSTTVEGNLHSKDERCAFEIRRKGLPQIEKCVASVTSPSQLRIECQTNPKELHAKLRVETRLYDANSTAFLDMSNATSSSSSPNVVLVNRNLTKSDLYQFSVVATNSAGASKPILFNYTVSSLMEEEEPPGKDDVSVLIAGTDVSPNDPIRMIPVIGILALVVIVLVLVAVITVVMMRGRRFSGHGSTDSLDGSGGKSHIAFNRSLDRDYEDSKAAAAAAAAATTAKKVDAADERRKRGRKKEASSVTASTSPATASEYDAISRMDSYEQLNDVQFEGFASSKKLATNNKRSSDSDASSIKIMSDKGTNTLNRHTIAHSTSLLESHLDLVCTCGMGSSGGGILKPSSSTLQSKSAEVPVGALCVIDDSATGQTAAEAGGLAYREVVRCGLHHRNSLGASPPPPSSPFDDFPFREAIQAPIPISRIGHIVLEPPPQGERADPVWPAVLLSPSSVAPTTTVSAVSAPRVTFAMDKTTEIAEDEARVGEKDILFQN